MEQRQEEPCWDTHGNSSVLPRCRQRVLLLLFREDGRCEGLAKHIPQENGFSFPPYSVKESVILSLLMLTQPGVHLAYLTQAGKSLP